MTRCCGEIVDSPYCPQCGQPRNNDPIQEIAIYLKGKRDRCKTNLEKSIAWASDPGCVMDEPYKNAKIERHRRGLAKQERWLQAFEKLRKDGTDARTSTTQR